MELIIGKELSPQVHSRIMQAAKKCAKTAEKIWEEMNTANEAWISSIPELRAREPEATSHNSPKPRGCERGRGCNKRRTSERCTERQ